MKITFNSSYLPADAHVFEPPSLLLDPATPLAESIPELYARHGVTSLIVEGGPETLRRFIAAGLYDEIRVETSPHAAAISAGDSPIFAPQLPADNLTRFQALSCEPNTIERYSRRNAPFQAPVHKVW